jgi:PHD/YefM family antitoxin component YafN of YafNO toxin-antitoxin module
MIMAVSEQYLVDAEGRRTAVLLSLEQYEKLMEDLHDLAIVAERREEKAISLQELKRRLKKDGLL